MSEFKQKLKKIAKLTPEAFFRVCDYSYMKEVSSMDFKNKIKEYELGLDEKTIIRICATLDEDFNGFITLEEYYFALECYNCRCEMYGPFDDLGQFDSF